MNDADTLWRAFVAANSAYLTEPHGTIAEDVMNYPAYSEWLSDLCSPEADAQRAALKRREAELEHFPLILIHNLRVARN